MDQATIERLVKNYIDGIATPAEEEELLQWYRKKSHQNVAWLGTLEEEKIVRERILENIRHQRNFPPIKKFNPYYYAVAASLLIFLSVGTYFYLRPVQHVTPMALLNSSIHSGKNQAVLILSNGTEVSLDDTKQGLLAKQGAVTIKRAENGQIIYDMSAARKVDSNALTFNTIVTPRGGQYAVILPDGSKVWLNSESSLKFPTVFRGKERHVQLTGEGYFEVAKNKQMPFKVDAKGSLVEVLGTHFNINAYQEESSVNTTLLEGSVKVSQGDRYKIIKPGQQAQVSNSIDIEDVDAEQYIAWKNGMFVFNDEDIHTLMNRIARWYDIDVTYKEDVSNLKFSGSISKYKDVDQILNKMEKTNTIHFKIEGRRIIVMR